MANPALLQDAHTVKPVYRDWDKHSFFGVYDGHGTAVVADFLAAHMAERVLRSCKGVEAESPVDVRGVAEGLRKAHLEIDAEMSEDKAIRTVARQGGATSVQALLSPEYIFVANCGDSRCVVSRVGSDDVWASTDHKPTDEPEVRRIERCGGSVMMRRVNGVLAVSRAFGDYKFKSQASTPAELQMVSVEPDVTVLRRSSMDEYLVLACDGVWDVMSSRDVIEFIRRKYDEGCIDLERLGGLVLLECLERGSRDNMTIVIVQLHDRALDAALVDKCRRAMDEADRKRAAAREERGAESARVQRHATARQAASGGAGRKPRTAKR